jgi:hypothetical protein
MKYLSLTHQETELIPSRLYVHEKMIVTLMLVRRISNKLYSARNDKVLDMSRRASRFLVLN